MTAFLTHFTFEFQAGLRNKALLFMNYLFPLSFYLIMGLVMTSTNPFFAEAAIPAMIVFSIMTGALLGLPAPLVEAREGGILRSYRINGVPGASILIIPAITTALHLLLVCVAVTATAPALFQAPLPVNFWYLLLCYLTTYFAFSGIGILIGVISANNQATTLWSQLMYLPSMLIGGLMVPTTILPAGLQKAGLLLPATHAMHAFRHLAMGYESSFSPWWSLAVLITGGIAAFILAALLFSWDSKNTTRRIHPALAILAMLPYILAAILHS